MYDVIVVDFPDPTNFSIGKLYTASFYRLIDQHLNASGYAVVQTTSPLIARKSFWTVATTIEAAGLTATPYHARRKRSNHGLSLAFSPGAAGD